MNRSLRVIAVVISLCVFWTTTFSVQIHPAWAARTSGQLSASPIIALTSPKTGSAKDLLGDNQQPLSSKPFLFTPGKNLLEPSNLDKVSNDINVSIDKQKKKSGASDRLEIRINKRSK